MKTETVESRIERATIPKWQFEPEAKDLPVGVVVTKMLQGARGFAMVKGVRLRDGRHALMLRESVVVTRKIELP